MTKELFYVSIMTKIIIKYRSVGLKFITTITIKRDVSLTYQNNPELKKYRLTLCIFYDLEISLEKVYGSHFA